LGSFGPTPHPSTPAHQQKKYTGEIKKKYYKLSRRQNIIINPGDMYTPQQQQQLSDNILINIHGNAAARE
jgi:BioD-like phosphotransacetylase family protein